MEAKYWSRLKLMEYTNDEIRTNECMMMWYYGSMANTGCELQRIDGRVTRCRPNE